MGFEPTTFVALSSAHRAIHLRHGRCSTFQNLATFNSYVTTLSGLVLLFVLVLTTHNPNTSSLLKGCVFESRCSQFFFILMFNLGIANGAKVDLKLRLLSPITPNIIHPLQTDATCNCSANAWELGHLILEVYRSIHTRHWKEICWGEHTKTRGI